MEIDWQANLIILFILILFSAFFSGSEVALFSLDRRKLKNNITDHPLIKRYLFYLLDYPRRLLITILIGNTIVNTAASIVAVFLALKIAEDFSLSRDLVLTIQIIALTILVILFGELTPKVWASKNPLAFSKVIAIPLYWVSVVLYPVSETLNEAIKLAVSKLKIDKSKTAISQEEIPELTELGHERGTIEEEEHGLIRGIVEFRSVTAQEIMTPRVDIISISSDTDFNDVLETLTASGHSRIPLYKDNLDNVIGIIYAKDILPYIRNNELKNNFSLQKISRKVLFVPKSKKVDELMHEFQRKKMHIAIVVDEYGGTAGLVTLEDIIEEIIGEIRDEYDKEENPVTKMDDKTFLVLGKLSIDDLNELLNTNILNDDEDFETVAGLVLNHAGNIPKEGYTFNLENHKFTVKEILKKRIKKVLIEKLPTE